MITHLVSTTEFVLQVTKTGINILDTYNQIKKYANFISQKPELWMFISCDEEGNVFEEPNNRDYPSDSEVDFNYQQAQSKILFKGWGIWNVNYITNGKVTLAKNFDRMRLISVDDPTDTEIGTWFSKNTIEEISEVIKLELTETALKQIGLWNV